MELLRREIGLKSDKQVGLLILGTKVMKEELTHFRQTLCNNQKFVSLEIE